MDDGDVGLIIGRTANFLRAQAKFLDEVLRSARLPEPPAKIKQAQDTAALDAEFEEWWKFYPRRDDKGHARIAFYRARKKAGLSSLIVGARSYADSRDGEDPKYTALPSTWLNGERWLTAALQQEVGTTEADHEMWRVIVKGWVARRKRNWPAGYGSPPGELGCTVPVEILKEFGL